jgi:hypothetical protein
LAGTDSGSRHKDRDASLSAAARELRDMQRLPQWKEQRWDKPGVEGNYGERKTRRYGNFTTSGKSRQTTKLTI